MNKKHAFLAAFLVFLSLAGNELIPQEARARWEMMSQFRLISDFLYRRVAGESAVFAKSPARETAVFPSYQADRDQEPSADPDSAFWKGVQGVFIENSILGGAVPDLRAEVRSRWTKDSLYFLFIGPYQALNLKPNPDTATETYKLWEWDCFEVYLGADFENINRYREFQMSPQGEFLDLAIDASVPKPGWSDERLWNSGLKVKARLDPAGKIWYGEMRIPVSAVDKRPAGPGNEMRINLFRQDGRAPKRDFLAWQTTGVWNPHHPEKFGMLRLVRGL